MDHPIKSTLLEAMAAYVLENGLNAASLRPLARAAGTSDRMLIYHFGSKDALIAELLRFLAADLAARLSEALPPRRAATDRQCLTEIVVLLRSEPVGRYMRVWLEIIASAAHGDEASAQTGHAMIGGFLDWIKGRLPDDCADPDTTAAAMLTLVEGILVMDTAGHAATADRAIDALFPE